MKKQITITLSFGPVYWEATYDDGEIGGADLAYTLEEWQALSEDERRLNILAWAEADGLEVTQKVEEEGG